MTTRALIRGLTPADCDKIPGIQFSKNGALVTQDQAAVLVMRRCLPSIPADKVLPMDYSSKGAVIAFDNTVYPFQKTGIKHVVAECLDTGSALLADDMGLGKSMQALVACEQLATKGQVVICCPRSVALSWVKEVKKWCGVGAFLIKDGKSAAKIKEEKYIVTSYDLSHTVDVLPAVLILDEAHLLRGRSTQRIKKIRQLAALSSYRIGLTGTPIWDRPRDFWAMLDLLWPGRFGNRFDFDLAYCNGKLNEWGGLDNKGATLTDELKARLETGLMLRRTREQVKLQLPSLQRQIVWLDADSKATAAFKRSAIGRAPGDMHNALEATLNAKVDAAVDEAMSADKCLVFTWTRAHATEIHRRLESNGRRVKLIHGGMTAQLRNKHIADATKEGASVVATVDSAGTGVDGLQHVACIGIFHALDWRPLILAQAEARLARIGQADGVIWKYLALRESADEIVLTTILNKLDQARAILGSKSNQGLRDTLADYGTASEADLLKEMYARMEDA